MGGSSADVVPRFAMSAIVAWRPPSSSSHGIQVDWVPSARPELAMADGRCPQSRYWDKFRPAGWAPSAEPKSGKRSKAAASASHDLGQLKLEVASFAPRSTPAEMSGVDGSESEPVAGAAVVALASQGVVEAAPADAGSLEAQSASTAMVELAQASVGQPATAAGSEALTLALATSVAPVAACAPAPTTTPATGTATPNANAAAKAVANGAA